MKEEGLNKAIEILEKISSEEKAYFEYTFDEESGEYYVIRANENGVKLFSLEFLKIAKRFEEIRNKKDKYFPIEFFNEKWFISHDSIPNLLEPLFIDRKEVKIPKPPKYTWKDNMVGFGFFLVLFLIIVCLIVGLINILYWIF